MMGVGARVFMVVEGGGVVVGNDVVGRLSSGNATSASTVEELLLLSIL